MQQLSTDLASSSHESSIWTDKELFDARVDFIRRKLARGWKYEGGYLVKGQARVKPSALMRSKSGDVDYNPARDAFAIKLGAKFIGPNRYQMPNGVLVDKHGSCIDPECCPECGSVQGEHRFNVPILSRNPFAKPWERAYTYCRRCVQPGELEQLTRQANAAPQPRSRRT